MRRSPQCISSSATARSSAVGPPRTTAIAHCWTGAALKADVIVISDVGNYSLGVPTLTTSLRGMAALDVEVETLEGAPGDAFSVWLDQARARLGADSTLKQLEGLLLVSVGGGAEPAKP